jgi:hypothetical protein
MKFQGKLHPIYLLRFHDHVQTHGENMNVVECEAIGYLVKEDKLAYYLASWICDSTVNTSDTEMFGILKSTVTKKRRLK